MKKISYKTIIIFFSIFMFVSFAYAKKSTIEDEIVKNGGVVISDPNFSGDYFLANTAYEIRESDKIQNTEKFSLVKLQKDRAINICRMLGYGSLIAASIAYIDERKISGKMSLDCFKRPYLLTFA